MRFRRPIIAAALKSVGIIVLGGVLILGCGERKSSEYKTPAIRLSLQFPEGSLFHRTAEKWADIAFEESGGTVAIEVHGGGQLSAETGGDQAALLRAGKADIALVRPRELARLNPSLNILYLPFLFPNRRSADAVLSGETAKDLLTGLDGGGIKGLGFFSGPFYQLSSSKRVVRVEDMEGLKLRLPATRNMEVDREAINLLHSHVVAVTPSRLRLAAMEGKIDALLATLDYYEKMDIRNWQKSISLLNYSFEPMGVCASAAFWERLNPKQREILLSSMNKAGRYLRQRLLAGERRIKKDQIKNGGAVLELIPEELTPFRDAVEKKCVEITPDINKTLLARIKEKIKKTREPFVYRFYDNLARAMVEAPPFTSDDFPAEKLPVRGEGCVLAKVGGGHYYDERYGIFCPVPCAIKYDVVIPQNARLEFGMGLLSRVDRQFPDGITFSIYLNRGNDISERRKIFSRTLSKNASGGDKNWIDELLDIELPAGEKARITLSLEAAGKEARKNRSYYSAIWANPVLYERDEATYRRNVILISLDTLRADAVHCYGNTFDASPHIDEMAENGALFSDCVSQDTWTLPSHMSIMTSLYPQQHNMWAQFWPDKPRGRPLGLKSEYLTLAEVMRNGGYDTVAFAESGFVNSIYGINQGFNSYSDFEPEKVAAKELPLQMGPLAFRDSISIETKIQYKTAPLIFAQALKWLRQRGDRKFFCFLHTYETHAPYTKNPYVRYFDPDYTGFIPDTIYIPELIALYKQLIRGELTITEADRRHLWALYSAQLRFVDDFVGQLLRALRELGLDRNTVVILTSDHGERLLEQGAFVGHRGIPTETLVRVPLIMQCPSIIPKGKRITGQVPLIDIMPTIIDFAGLKKPSVIEGKSLYSRILKTGGKSRYSRGLEEGTPSKEKPVYSQTADLVKGKDGTYTYRWSIGMKRGRKKIIYYPLTGKASIYNLASDPSETKDIAGRFKDTAKLKEMARSFIRRRRHGYYLVFSGGGDNTFEGTLSVQGVFSLILGEGVSYWLRDHGRTSSVKFAMEPGTDVHVLNFDVSPADAAISLDLKLDGVRAPELVFKGDSSAHPRTLPWILDKTVKSKRNPYSFAQSDVTGCRVINTGSPYLIDNAASGGLRLARMTVKGLVPAVRAGTTGAASTSEEIKKAEQLLKRQKFLGQTREAGAGEENEGKTSSDEEEKEKMKRHIERLKALGYVE